MIAPVAQGLVAHVMWLFSPPYGKVLRLGGSVCVVTGDSDPYRNGVLRAELGDGDLGAAIDRLLDPFDDLPMMWWSFAPGPDPRVEESLFERGFFLESDRPSMTLVLNDFRSEQPPDELVVERVRDETAFSAWLEVVGDAFGSSDQGTSISTMSFRRWGFGADSPFHHYISYLDGEPAGGATMTYVDDIVSLGNISTRRSMQKRGIATATVGCALVDARDRGMRIASLSADPAGTKLYTKLGFEVVGRHFTYVRKT